MYRGELERTLLLGADHGQFDRVHIHAQGNGRTVCGISAGASLGQSNKTPRETPNEDALLAIDEGPRTLLAVADAHFGCESSHELLGRLSEQMASLPREPSQLMDAVRATYDGYPSARYRSESTLLVAVLDRECRTGFGLSFGDSSLVLLDRAGEFHRPQRKTGDYLSPCRPAGYDPGYPSDFHFTAEPGSLVLAFTDGIDECHYRHPKTSIRSRHIAELWTRSSADVERMTRSLIQLALAGVDGHPGGEDNVAVVATSLGS